MHAVGQAGQNVVGGPNQFSLDFPFSSFVKTAGPGSLDFNDLDIIRVIFSSGTPGAVIKVKSIEVAP